MILQLKIHVKFSIKFCPHFTQQRIHTIVNIQPAKIDADKRSSFDYT